jgi:spore maturation protein CgeB
MGTSSVKPMKVFVLGKRGSIVRLSEDSVAGFRAAGHAVRLGITRDPRLSRSIDAMLTARRLGVPRAVLITRAIRRFAPDLIVTIGPFLMPLSVVEQVAAMPNRPPLVGWVGDLFDARSGPMAALHDALAYSDTGLLALHRTLGFRSSAAFVPHAANPRLDLGVPAPETRDRSMVFVASPTPLRRQVVDAIRLPVSLYGLGWTASPSVAHAIHARRIGVDELARLYRAHLAVLNVRNEANVLHGLNQRHFDPYLAGTPVVSDAQDDIALCFEPGREMLVYRDVEELNDIHARLLREPEFALSVGARGRQRVLAEHGYARRLAALAALVGVA